MLRPVVAALLGPRPPVALRCWDGSQLGPAESPATIVIRSPRALRRLLYAPNELGLGRAYVAGELDIEGDLFALLDLVESVDPRDEDRDRLTMGVQGTVAVWRAARALGVLGPPLPRPVEEVRLGGRRHSKRRDAGAVSHHYDVSNSFYGLVLGETMTYSCAYFPTLETNLDDAQTSKYELICRKLGLRPGMRLLDVGCGWGGMARHAAEHHGVRVVGITVSAAQREAAAGQVAQAGLADRVEIRLQDYRDVGDGPFDAISSIGMFEHVGLARMSRYFEVLFQLLAAGGRLLNHAVSRPRNHGVQPNSFIERYVFPDSEVLEVGSVISAMHHCGYEVRDVESLREHYARTLRHWVANLENHWDEACRLAGPARARIWHLYMAGCCRNFMHGELGLHQVLAVKPGPGGASGMPATRAGWTRGEPGSSVTS